MEQILEIIGQYPIVASILAVIGGLRLVFKPVMTAIEAVVAATPTKKDDLALEKTKDSAIYKAFVWLVDYLSSVKLPKK
jgi:hypothetical protein